MHDLFYFRTCMRVELKWWLVRESRRQIQKRNKKSRRYHPHSRYYFHKGRTGHLDNDKHFGRQGHHFELSVRESGGYRFASDDNRESINSTLKSDIARDDFHDDETRAYHTDRPSVTPPAINSSLKDPNTQEWGAGDIELHVPRLARGECF